MARWLLPGSRPRPATINISIVHCSSSRKSLAGEISALETVYKVDLYRIHAVYRARGTDSHSASFPLHRFHDYPSGERRSDVFLVSLGSYASSVISICSVRSAFSSISWVFQKWLSKHKASVRQDIFNHDFLITYNEREKLWKFTKFDNRHLY